MGTVTIDALSVEAQQTVAGEGQHFTPDRVAALLERWRPAVLREMGRRHLWRGASPAECEDQFQDVALVLCGSRFARPGDLGLDGSSPPLVARSESGVRYIRTPGGGCPGCSWGAHCWANLPHTRVIQLCTTSSLHIPRPRAI